MIKILILLSLLFLPQAYGRDLQGRLGVGMANPFTNGIPGVSIKLHRNRSFAIGAILALELDDNTGGHGAGVKFYKNLFDEPQLHFFSALMLAHVGNNISSTEDESGLQIDLTVGSEFNFVGLESIGFSFETGVSFDNTGDDLVIKTTGQHIVTAGVHFYL